MSDRDVIHGLKPQTELLMAGRGTFEERKEAVLKIVAKAWEAGWDACAEEVKMASPTIRRLPERRVQ